MRTIMSFAVILGLAACRNEAPRDAAPCTRAVANAKRLVGEDPGARARYGDAPLTAERCRTAKAEDVKCVGYASDVRELEGCAGGLLGAR